MGKASASAFFGSRFRALLTGYGKIKRARGSALQPPSEQSQQPMGIFEYLFKFTVQIASADSNMALAYCPGSPLAFNLI